MILIKRTPQSESSNGTPSTCTAVHLSIFKICYLFLYFQLTLSSTLEGFWKAQIESSIFLAHPNSSALSLFAATYDISSYVEDNMTCTGPARFSHSPPRVGRQLPQQ